MPYDGYNFEISKSSSVTILIISNVNSKWVNGFFIKKCNKKSEDIVSVLIDKSFNLYITSKLFTVQVS